MKKIFAILIVFCLSVSFVYAQTTSVSNVSFIGKVIDVVVSTFKSTVGAIANLLGIDDVDYGGLQDIGDVIDDWNDLDPADEDFCKKAKEILKNHRNGESITLPVEPPEDNLTKQDSIDYGISQDGNTGVIGSSDSAVSKDKIEVTPMPIPLPEIPSQPVKSESGAFKGMPIPLLKKFVEICEAEEEEDDGTWTQEDCDQAKREASDVAHETNQRAMEWKAAIDEWKESGDESDKVIADRLLGEYRDGLDAWDIIDEAIRRCCPFALGGGASYSDFEMGDPANPERPKIPEDPNPPEDPEDPNLPPEDPIQPIFGDRYVCDFTSASYNNLYNCIVASGPVQPGELPCDINGNQEIPVTQEVEKMFLWIIPYTDTVTEMVTYNPACFWNDDGVTPPPTGPDEPITPPGNPGDPGSGSGGDESKPPSTPKPSVPENPDDKKVPINPISCRVPTFSFYDKLAKPPKYVYNMFTTQKIVENPMLEYYAQDCDTCKLVIESEDGNSVEKFIADNSLFQGMLEPTNVIDEKNKRYVFEANLIKLDTRGLKSGDYIISMHCTDPIFGGPIMGMRKFTDGEEVPPWLKLTIAPQIRWRETVPVISGHAE